MQVVSYLIFTLALVYVDMWLQINLFISSLGKKKKPMTAIEDKKVSDTLLEKTNTKIKSIRISESNLLFGAMAGIPGNPQLVLSRKLYATFSWSELEYVILHEAGHHQLGHSLKELVQGLLFLMVGLLILAKFPTPILGTFLGVCFGILMIQLAKFNELAADNYSLDRLGDPKGMITATEKFRKAWESYDPTPFLMFLFYRGNPYENRIKMVERKLKNKD